MRDYSKGKIYKIVCNSTGLIYVGSTCEPTLARRLAKHVANYNEWKKGKSYASFVSSYKILEKSDYDIVLIETFSCQSKDELFKRERYFIENFECVNKMIPFRDEGEYRKIFYTKNKDQILEKQKKYREENIEMIKNRQKEYLTKNYEKLKEHYQKYRDENKEMIKKRDKEYREKNKEQINERKKIKKECICGCFISSSGLSNHIKTKKHQEFLKKYQKENIKF